MRITRRAVTPQAAPEPEPAKTAPEPKRPVARKKVVIPISKAMPKPEQVDDESGPKVDYKGIIEKYNGKITNRKTAIRAFCVTCCNGQLSEVRLCTVTKCPLHPFRLGDDPHNLKRQKSLAAQQAEEKDDEE